jgi:hypothetical protein
VSHNLVIIFEPSAPPLAALVPALAEFDRLDLQEGTAWGDQIVVYDGERHVFVQPYPPEEMEAEHSFDDWPAGLVPPRASGLVVAYSDIALAKRVAVALARRFRFWVDPNMGTGEVYASEEFVRRTAREPGWDWRDVPVTTRTG